MLLLLKGAGRGELITEALESLLSSVVGQAWPLLFLLEDLGTQEGIGHVWLIVVPVRLRDMSSAQRVPSEMSTALGTLQYRVSVRGG